MDWEKEPEYLDLEAYLWGFYSVPDGHKRPFGLLTPESTFSKMAWLLARQW